jgi:hypothetical protein
MKTPEGDKIRQILNSHRGRENAIHARDIATELGWTHGRERFVRTIIASESILWAGQPHQMLICSAAGPDGGFFVAANIEEAYAHESWLSDMRDTAQGRLDEFHKACDKLGIRFLPGPKKEAA